MNPKGPRAMKNRKTWAVYLLKISVTLLFFWWIFRSIDYIALLNTLSNADLLIYLAALVCVICQIPLSVVRWNSILRKIEHAPSFFNTMRMFVVGNCLNQAAPSFVAGDALRAYFVQKEGISIKSAAMSVILDRYFAAIGLVVVVMSGLPIIKTVISSGSARQAVFTTLLIVGVVLVGAFVLSHRSLAFLERRRLTKYLREFGVSAARIAGKPRTFFRIIGASIAIHLLDIVAVFAIARSVGVHVELSTLLLIVPTVILVAMIPISIAGWGVREGAMITGLGMVGVSPPEALTISILYGLSVLMVYAPGGLMWFGMTAEVPPAAAKLSSATERLGDPHGRQT